ncbi:hypothetical protein B0H14DRAFT_2557196 [Mycena olivaceomarginata]|nr:hypothetical protein B0H14DRAFT_2557196 [Mycena olivaceomarginata]
MPRQLAAMDIRLSNVAACLTPAVALLNELNDAFGPPFVDPILKTIVSLMTAVQNVKRNKEQCIELMEDIHKVLVAIVDLHITSETGSLIPSILDHIGKFMETLHKIHTFFGQQTENRIKQLFQQRDMNALFKDCCAGLDDARKIFKIETSATIFSHINEMKKTTEMMHKQLLELISTLSEGSMSDKSSSVYKGDNESWNSTISFSMLPSKPKIFHGRDFELNEIMELLCQESPRIAILGGGGMGKTSLARAVLHHPDICTRFEHRFFVSAESATNNIELAALIGLHVGLNPGADLTKPVVQYFLRQPPCMLILDNLETPWEPMQSRGGVEEFLSLLTDVLHVALIFTDNMPLAVDLIAHLVDYEGPSSVLNRWEAEKTSLLSAGDDRKSNLDASIRLSLSSPRITTGARKLLSLLSILPDGLSDVELIQSNLPIQRQQKASPVSDAY